MIGKEYKTEKYLIKSGGYLSFIYDITNIDRLVTTVRTCKNPSLEQILSALNEKVSA